MTYLTIALLFLLSVKLLLFFWFFHYLLIFASLFILYTYNKIIINYLIHFHECFLSDLALT